MITAQIAYESHCSVCQKIHTWRMNVRLGEVLPNPSLPEGWRYVEGRLYCPLHKVKVLIFVDGEAVEGDAQANLDPTASTAGLKQFRAFARSCLVPRSANDH